MTMESPAVESGIQGVVNTASQSPAPETAPMMHTLQPMAVSSVPSTDSQALGQLNVSSVSMAQMPQTFVMAQPTSGEQGTTVSNPQLMMQPPVSMMMPQYSMILPGQGIVDQQGLLQQGGGSPANNPGSPALSGSRSNTPQHPSTTVYQQVIQVHDAQNPKTDSDAVASPIRQGSVGSGGSPAPLGSPLPMQPPQTMHLPLQQGQLQLGLPTSLRLHQETPMIVDIKEEEKLDISKLKPPKKPLTPYMRFSKSIWQQVKAANQSLSVCEIGATIGRMWRELADTEKQKYNQDFANDKISYDVELKQYLKLTGLQASDLVKSRPKKKASTASAEAKEAKAVKRQQSHASPSPQPAVTQNTVVQQIPGQALMMQTSINGPVPVSIHNSPGATAGIPQQVLSGALSGLPHFSQVWTGQQGQTILSQGGQASGQEQVIVQQGAHGQQVVINALGLPPGAVVNGSTASAAGDNMISGPILIQPTGDHTTQLFSAETEGQRELKQDSHTDTATSQQVNMAQLTALGWHQVMASNPELQQQQQNVLNLLNMAAAQTGVQPDQLTQAAQIAGLPLGLPQNIVSIGATNTDSSESQAVAQPGTDQTSLQQAQSLSDSATPRSEVTTTDQNGVTTSHMTVPNGPNTSLVTVAQMPSAHNLYNSYGFNPWQAFPQQLLQTHSTVEGGTQEGATDGASLPAGTVQVVYSRESLLETELHHLRSALSEKTKEVQRLTQELEKAYSIIEQLKQQNPTAVIHLPAPQQELANTPGSGQNTPQPT